MDIGAIIIIILIGGILVLTFYIIGLYNTLLDAKNKLENKFSKINTELKKEIKLIPSIIEVLKKHTKHEEKTINEVEELNSKSKELKSINDKISFINDLNKTLKKVYKLEETYKELKSSRKYNSIKKELNEIEDKIVYAKEFYNNTVAYYNSLLEVTSTKIIANIFKFDKANKM